MAGGEKEWFLIERRSCPAGCGLHRLIPDFLAPFKHYDIDIITGVLNGTITPETLAFEDYPCERTMERWREWIVLNLVFINAYLKSVGICLFAMGIALAYAVTDLVEELQERNRHGWLKIVIRAVYNTGSSLEHYLELAIGTEVDVYSSENGWTEIEWNRWHGYVKNEFVKQLGQ